MIGMKEPQNPYGEIQEPDKKSSTSKEEPSRGCQIGCLLLLIFIVGLFAIILFDSPHRLKKRRFEQSIKELLASEGNINSIEGILHMAVEEGDIEAVKILLDSGADIDSTACITLETPLHRAVTRENIAMVKLLIDSGADLNLGRENDGQTPLDMAQDRGLVEIEQLLRANGASISQ